MKTSNGRIKSVLLTSPWSENFVESCKKSFNFAAWSILSCKTDFCTYTCEIKRSLKAYLCLIDILPTLYFFFTHIIHDRNNLNINNNTLKHL